MMMSIKKRREIFDLKEGGIAAAAKSETRLMQFPLQVASVPSKLFELKINTPTLRFIFHLAKSCE